jgi:hypothetical protein
MFNLRQSISSIGLLIFTSGSYLAVNTDVANSAPTFKIPDWQVSAAKGKREDLIVKGDNCPASLTALIPEFRSARGEASVWTLTMENAPTFWFSVSEGLTENIPGQFKLRNQLGETTFSVTATKSGIVGLKIPQSLNPTEKYQWTFEVVCSKTDPSKNPRVFGWIQQQPNSNLDVRLSKAKTPQEKSTILNEEYMYFDALTVISELKMNEKDDGAWKKLLEKWGLAQLGDKKLVEIRKLKK